jgi:hypothetical protein
MQGMLLKKQNGTGIVLTSDGTYCRGAISEEALLGEEATVVPPRWRRPPLWLAAAVTAVVFLGLGAYRFLAPSSWAYVAIDVEPSVEFTVDRGLTVIGLKGYNFAGKKLASALGDIRGKPLDYGVESLLEKALAAGYLREGEDNIVMVTGVCRQEDERIGPEALANMVADSYPVQRGKVEIIALYTDTDVHRQAAKNGLSSGRYLLQQELKRRGVNIAGRVMREESLRSLGKGHNLVLSAVMDDTGWVLTRPESSFLERRQKQDVFYAAPVPVQKE